jgi:hypothetical protein
VNQYDRPVQQLTLTGLAGDVLAAGDAAEAVLFAPASPADVVWVACERGWLPGDPWLPVAVPSRRACECDAPESPLTHP